MREILSKIEAIGGDGAVASQNLSIDGGFLIADIQVKYPLAKVVAPVTDLIDKAAAEIEAKFPLGGEAKAILDPIVAGLKAEIATLLGEV